MWARDWPRMRVVLADNRCDGLKAASYDGVIANGGEPSDPTMRMAIAFADPENGAYDEALADMKACGLLVDTIFRDVSSLHRKRARWMPNLAHVEACCNPYGCPDERPAAIRPRRKGYCHACYAHQLKHDGEHRRTARMA